MAFLMNATSMFHVLNSAGLQAALVADKVSWLACASVAAALA